MLNTDCLLRWIYLALSREVDLLIVCCRVGNNIPSLDLWLPLLN